MDSKREVTRKSKPRPGQLKVRPCDIILTLPNRPDRPTFLQHSLCIDDWKYIIYTCTNQAQCIARMGVNDMHSHGKTAVQYKVV